MQGPADIFGRTSGLAARIVAEYGFRAEPMTLVDVGCSGGIHRAWDVFGEDLIAYAFDPNRSEIERLRTAERRPGITYVPAFVTNPVFTADPAGSYSAWGRSSAAA